MIGLLILMKMGVVSERLDEMIGFECCFIKLEVGIFMVFCV